MRLDSAAGWRMCTSNVSQRDTPGWRIARVQAAAAGIDPAHCAVHINILIINYGLQQPKALHIFPRALVCLLHCVADCAPLVALICKHGRRMSTQIPLAQPTYGTAGCCSRCCCAYKIEKSANWREKLQMCILFKKHTLGNHLWTNRISNFQFLIIFVVFVFIFKCNPQDVLCDRAHEEQRVSLLAGENELFILSMQ